MGRADHPFRLPVFLFKSLYSLSFFVPLAACDRGCARDWAEGSGVGGLGPGVSLSMNAMDCPDGLARCEEGVVFAARLATIPQPCKGPTGACSCPWERLGNCPDRCAADGVELVIDRARAEGQLCAPRPDAGSFVAPLGSAAAASVCDEGQRYRCADALVIECQSGVAVGRCVNGCFAQTASIDDDDVSREAAFAMLCSR
jgi:hypothetical protein